MLESHRYLVPQDAHSIETKDALSTRVRFLLRYLNLPDSMSNRIEVEDRLVTRFETLHGRSNLTTWRLLQLDNLQMVNVLLEPVSNQAFKAVKKTRSTIAVPVLH